MTQMYYKLTINANDNDIEALTALVFDLGSTGIEGTESGMIAYFGNAADKESITATLSRYKETLKFSGLSGDYTFKIELFKNEDWLVEWKKRIEPVEVGDNFVYLAPWHEHMGRRKKIIIDPGAAFGTGKHETSQLCIEFMERISDTEEKGKFLDIGTGSGILALTAHKLGYSPVIALDIDPVAIENAKKNVAHNSASQIELICSDINSIKGKFSLIVCNLTLEIIKSLLDEIFALKAEKGKIIFSGILHGSEQELIELIEERNYTDIEVVVKGYWAGILID